MQVHLLAGTASGRGSSGRTAPCCPIGKGRVGRKRSCSTYSQLQTVSRAWNHALSVGSQPSHASTVQHHSRMGGVHKRHGRTPATLRPGRQHCRARALSRSAMTAPAAASASTPRSQGRASAPRRAADSQPPRSSTLSTSVTRHSLLAPPPVKRGRSGAMVNPAATSCRACIGLRRRTSSYLKLGIRQLDE